MRSMVCAALAALVFNVLAALVFNVLAAPALNVLAADAKPEPEKDNWFKRAGKAVGSDAKAGWHKAKNGYAKSGKQIGHDTANASKRVGREMKESAKRTGKAAKEEFK
jgi:hypothetical protein